MERFKDHCTVISGFAFKSADLHDYDDIPIIKIGNISNGGNIDIKKETQYVSNEFLSIDKKYHIKCGDILISLTGSHINQPNSMVGRSCRSYDTDTYLLNQRAGKVICNDDTNDDYMYYLLNLRAVKENIINRAYGAANQVNVSPSDIMKIKWTFPDIIIQNRIGAILSNYDKLIFINTKRIKTLEQMAENLYKEWFVRFRFPGHEKAEFENGIPKGWSYKSFEEIYSYIRGVSYSTEEIDCEQGINLINLKNIQGYGGFRKDGTKSFDGKFRNDQIVRYKDLVMGVTDMTQERRTVGAVALIPKIDGVISADLIKITSKIDSIFSYCMFRWGGYSALISQFGNGANVIHLKPTTIKNVKMLIPEKSVIDTFVKIMGSTFDYMMNLDSETDSLIKQRDLLLPRLMSGKLEV